MSQQQRLDLQLRGLYTAPNNFSGVPQGAFDIADNVVINSKNLVTSRRGQTQYGVPLNIDEDQVNKMFNYSSSLIANYADKLAYDSGNGVWVDYAGTYLPPSDLLKMRSLEAQRNFYFTTSQGIYKIDSLTSNPRTAGAPEALGGTGSITGSSGFLVDNSAVAYRVVWGYRDLNNNLILGVPSQRLIIGNNSGGAKDVSLTFLIPETITTQFFYQVYRSNGSATVTDEPSDELQLVAEGNPTAGEIIAKSFTIIDSTPYSLMRAALYTSPSQEGIANANYQPPFAVDMDVFKNCAFYGNAKQKQALTLALIGVGQPGFSYETLTGTTVTTNAQITGISTTADLRVGMRVVGAGIDTDSRILTIDSGTAVTMTKPALASATVSLEFQDRFSIGGYDYFGGSVENSATNTFLVDTSSTPGSNINATAISLVDVINKSSTNTTVYAYYVSGLDDLPGQLRFTERNLGGTVFSATSTAGSSFSPVLPISGTAISSDNDAKQNRVYISKPGQVESVPIYRYFDVGSANFPIQRVVALRDGIFFFKQDGIFRISGETFESFTVTLVDNTVTLKAPESAVPFNNQVFCFTTQGIVAVTDAEVKIMSVPIETKLIELSSEQYTNFSTASFGVAYESARLYMFYTVSEVDDTFATQAFVYNYLTDSWTRWEMNRTCGIVNPTVDKLFMAQPDTGQILVERKNYTNQDYADEQYAVTIATVNSLTSVTLVDATIVEPGMTLVQGSRSTYIEDVQGNVLTITEISGMQTGAATVYTPIDNKIQWVPIDVENPGLMKQFSEISLMFKDAAFREIEAGFSSNTSSGTTVVDVKNQQVGGWGTFPWGEQPWGGVLGGQNILRTYVPREKQRCCWMQLYVRTNEAFTGFSLQGVSLVYNPMSTRIK